LGAVFAATLLLLGMLLGAAPAHGQSLAGLAALSGTVRDSTGALIMDAAVTISNHNLGIDRKITTNSEGYFIASSLPPASGYEVTVTKTGFTGYSAKNVQLMVGQNITIPVQLSVAQQAESVTVNAEVPLIEESKSGVSTAVENTQIQNLPINGRRVDQFALLTPGAVTDGSGGAVSFRGVPGGNAFLQDGNDVTQQWGIDIAGGSNVPSSISQDAVLEFQVQLPAIAQSSGARWAALSIPSPRADLINFMAPPIGSSAIELWMPPIPMPVTIRPSLATRRAPVSAARSSKTSCSSLPMER
jgi:hypothetical protein